MAQPYVGEIRIVGFSFAPAGWELCNGQLLSISENETLFNLIGTTYGGDGESTFALPDLQGRVPIHQGNGTVLAETGGVESVTLTLAQIPQHAHLVNCSAADASSRTPAATSAFGTEFSKATNLYASGTPDAAMMAQSCSTAGGNQPHNNMQPSLAVNFIISLYGIFPSPT
jgi:microcystin-dependent protein